MGLLGHAPPGKGTPVVPSSAPVSATHKEDSYGNPLLAIIIESQIQQQLQGMQALSFLSKMGGAMPFSGGSGGTKPFVLGEGGAPFGAGDSRSSLLGDAPLGQGPGAGPMRRGTTRDRDMPYQDRFSGRRKPLMGDAPPGYSKDGRSDKNMSRVCIHCCLCPCWLINKLITYRVIFKFGSNRLSILVSVCIFAWILLDVLIHYFFHLENK